MKKSGWSQFFNVALVSVLLMGNKEVDNTSKALMIDLTLAKKEIKKLYSQIDIYKDHYVPKSYKHKFITKPGVNMEVDECLLEALKEYPGPSKDLILINSGNDSKHSKHSDHYKGMAVDISKNSTSFIKWLVSEDSKEWLKEYNIDFYLENMHTHKYHENYMYNPHATGPHVHLWIKN